MAESVLDGLSGDASRIPSNVSRKTVADGSWLQKYTFGKLSARDVYLAEAIDDNVSIINNEINEVSEVVDDLNDDVTTISSKLENMSPLTYQGNGSIDEIKALTAKNGDVYSITGITPAKKKVWWYGGESPTGDDDFRVGNNDEVAYTSSGDKWFPIGQDIHVEYIAGDNIKITDNNEISVSGQIPVNCISPISGGYNSQTSSFDIRFSPSQLVPEYISAYEQLSDTNNRPIIWYNSGVKTLNYNPNVHINGDTLSANKVYGNSAVFNSYKIQEHSNNDVSYNLLWTNKTNSSLFYTNTAFLVNPKSGLIYSPKLSASTINLTGAGNITTGNESNVALTIGNPDGEHLVIDSNEIAVKNAQNSKNGTLWLNDEMVDGKVKACNLSSNNFETPSAKIPKISATNVTALTANGNSAKFNSISASAMVLNGAGVGSNTGTLIIGNPAGTHLEFDGHDIRCRNNTSTAILDLNYNGGTVRCYGNTFSASTASITNLYATNARINDYYYLHKSYLNELTWTTTGNLTLDNVNAYLKDYKYLCIWNDTKLLSGVSANMPGTNWLKFNINIGSTESFDIESRFFLDSSKKYGRIYIHPYVNAGFTKPYLRVGVMGCVYGFNSTFNRYVEGTANSAYEERGYALNFSRSFKITYDGKNKFISLKGY